MGMLLYMMEQQRQNKNMAEGATPKVEVAPKPTSPKEETEEKPKAEKEKEKEKEKVKITKADIMKMNVATVRAYAETQGIKGANAMSGAELKRILGNKLFEESVSESE